MHFFVTGVNGQLGYDVMKELVRRGHICTGSGSRPSYSGSEKLPAGHEADYVCMDITDKERVRSVLKESAPDVIVHCAGWTAVDAAEEESNHAAVLASNVDGTRNIALAARELGCKLIYISTDYVFDGHGDMPWKADGEEYKPLCLYGQTKLDGEQIVRELVEKHFIVRIAWAFGKNGNNFVKTIIRIGRERGDVRVVNDQFGTPTYTADLSRLLVDMAETDKYGNYHATNEGGYVSWYEFTGEIYRQAGIRTKVIPVSTAEYGMSKAVRPFNSRLDRSKLKEAGFVPLPDWRDALTRYLAEMGWRK